MAGPLASRDLALFLSGSAASWAGLGVADVLLLWLVFSETGDPLSVAYFGIAQALPPIAVGLFAGVLADRYDRRRLLTVTSAAQGVLLAVLVGAYWAFGFSLWFTLGIVVGLEAVAVMFRPTASAFLPDLVPGESLDNANALAEATTSVATTVGAAGAAALVLAVGAVPGFGVNIALFAAAAVLLAMITVRELARPDSAPARARQPWRRDLGEVVAYLRRHPALWRLTVVEILVGFFVTMFSTFLVVYTVDLVGAPASQFGYLIAAYSGGFFVGSLLAPRLGVVRWYGWAFVVTILVAAGLLGLLVVVPRFETAVVALLLLGGFLGLVVTGFVTLVQRSVPSELLGRYFGLNEMLTWTVAPIGIAVGGILTDAYGVRVTYIVAAAGLLLVGALALALKDVRQVGYRRTPGLPAASEPARENPPA